MDSAEGVGARCGRGAGLRVSVQRAYIERRLSAVTRTNAIEVEGQPEAEERPGRSSGEARLPGNTSEHYARMCYARESPRPPLAEALLSKLAQRDVSKCSR